MSAAPQYVPFTAFEQLRAGRDIVRQEADALQKLASRLDASFCGGVELMLACEGSVIVTGMGKAGLIGQKVAATLSSTGTRAHFMHPGEAVHGDLGCLHANDVLLALSNSGETEEINQVLPTVARLEVPIIAVTSSDQNTLASHANVTIAYGRVREACPWGLAPSTSTTAMLAVGDALALVVSRAKGFTPEKFALFHPAGNLGRQLKLVAEFMRPLEQLRMADVRATVRDVFAAGARNGRRTGAVLLTDEDRRLAGLFTDSDLARLLEQRRDDAFDRPIAEVMTADPLTVSPGATFSQVVELLSERKISEVPVIDEEGRPVGLIDITDVIGWMPHETGE